MSDKHTSDDTEEEVQEGGWQLTEQGLQTCVDIHYAFFDGQSLEEIAKSMDQDVLAIRIMMHMFYETIDINRIEL